MGQKPIYTAAIFVVSVLMTACAPESGPENSSDTPATAPAIQISQDDFAMIEGDWTGTLSYRDFTSDQITPIPIQISIGAAEGGERPYDLTFPKEPDANSSDAFRISPDGTQLNGHDVIKREVHPDGRIEIAVRYDGQDNGRDAIIREEYDLTKNLFVMRKNIRYLDEETFFQRNSFGFRRKPGAP